MLIVLLFLVQFSFILALIPSTNKIPHDTLVICGPSGVGKGTLIQFIIDKYPNRIGLSVSQTTRKPRPGEIHGYHYNFIKLEEILNMSEDELKKTYLEYTRVHGNFYGTRMDSISKIHNDGKLCIFEIDSYGVKQVKQKSHLSCKYIFIAPPYKEKLEERLRDRGTETEEQIQIRLKNALTELSYGTSKNFDYILVNREIKQATEEFENVLHQWYPYLNLVNESNSKSLPIEF
jgi:guanylate kinase